jgi:hypothetical protein
MALCCYSPEVEKWRDALQEAGVIPPQVRRIIIDIDMDAVIKVYYETLADAKMFGVDMARALRGAEVIGVAEFGRQKGDAG